MKDQAVAVTGVSGETLKRVRIQQHACLPALHCIPLAFIEKPLTPQRKAEGKKQKRGKHQLKAEK
jgi:hypothetical protein